MKNHAELCSTWFWDSSLLGHGFALCGAGLAFICAFYAVVILKHGALCGAFFTDGRTKLTQVLGILSVKGHKTG